MTQRLILQKKSSNSSCGYSTRSQASPSQCTSRTCSVHEGRLVTMEILLQAQADKNDTLEQRMRHFESILTSMGALHTSLIAQHSPQHNGGSTSFVDSAFAGMITIV